MEKSHVTPAESAKEVERPPPPNLPRLAHSRCWLRPKDVDANAQNRSQPTFVRKTTERRRVHLRRTGSTP